MATIPSISLIPSGVKAGEIYSVLPTDGSGDFTFDRGNGASTRINKQKLIESVSNDVPRLDYGISDCPALLLEPSRTNLLPYSEEFTRSNWGKVNTTITPFYSISPDGSATASLLQRTSSSANYMSEGITKPSAAPTQVTGTWFVKKGVGDYFATRIQGAYPARVDLIYQHSTKSIISVVATTFTIIDSSVVEVANGFVRISLSVLTDSASSMSFSCSPNSDASQIDGSGSSADSNVIIWGAQLEVGSYPSSYIPTSGSSQTRQVESNEVTTGLEDKIGQTEGVFYVDFEYLYQTTTDASTDLQRDLTVLGNTTDLSEFVFFDNYRGVFRVAIDGSGMTYQSLGSTDAGSAQANTRYKLAIKYKSGDSKAYLNGLLLGAVGTATINFAVDLNGIFFSYNNSSRSFKNQKKVYDLKVYETGLSDAELETLTSYISFNAMALAFNYKLQ